MNATVPVSGETRVKMVVDPEAQGWSVTAGFRNRPEAEETVDAYRRSLVRSLGLQMLNARLGEVARDPKAPFLAASADVSSIGRNLSLFELSADVPAGGTAAGLEAVVREARRVQQFGFAAAELDRARLALLAGYERAYNERNTAESAPLANELVRHFLDGEPAPGIAYEFELAKRFVPGVTAEEVTAQMRELIRDDNRFALGVAPASPGGARAHRRHVENGAGRRVCGPGHGLDRRASPAARWSPIRRPPARSRGGGRCPRSASRC